MDDFEWIEKDELIETKPDGDAARLPAPCDVPKDVPGTAHDMPTKEEEMTGPNEATHDDVATVEPPVHEVPFKRLCHAAAALCRTFHVKGFAASENFESV